MHFSRDSRREREKGEQFRTHTQSPAGSSTVGWERQKSVFSKCILQVYSPSVFSPAHTPREREIQSGTNQACRETAIVERFSSVCVQTDSGGRTRVWSDWCTANRTRSPAQCLSHSRICYEVDGRFTHIVRCECISRPSTICGVRMEHCGRRPHTERTPVRTARKKGMHIVLPHALLHCTEKTKIRSDYSDRENISRRHECLKRALTYSLPIGVRCCWSVAV